MCRDIDGTVAASGSLAVRYPEIRPPTTDLLRSAPDVLTTKTLHVVPQGVNPQVLELFVVLSVT